MTPAPAESGFTLVEMVVALLIFAILAAAGVGLLRASVDTQEVVGETLADLGAAARLRTLLQADLGQVVIRPVEGAPAGFAGEGSRMTLVRAYDPAERVPGSSGLQAVRWSLSGTALLRQPIGNDGTAAGAPSTLARDVTSLSLRYRSSDGSWRASWSAAPDEPALPAAVELEFQRRGEAATVLMVALPQGPAPILAPPPQGPRLET